MSALVEATGLALDYGHGETAARALDGVDLAIGRGERWAIVGESGSGKTTFGMAIGRLLPAEANPQGGSLRVEGEEVFALAPAALRQLRRDKLGFVFQNPMSALDPTMKIGRQVALALGGRPGRQAIAAQIAKAGLDEPERVAASYPHELSGGMAQRVVIAMAIARRPDLLIADEPTASLDVSIRLKVMQTLVDLSEESGASLLVLSHDLHLVARYCSLVAVMYGGRVVEAGPTEAVFGAPAHPYTKGLLLAAAGNEAPGQRLKPITGLPPLLRGRAEHCSFAPRCPRAEPLCREERPPEVALPAGRRAACHFAATVLEE